jgi:cardiolipin synthase
MNPIHTLVYFLLFFISFLSSFHAILHKRDSRAAFGWIVTCFVLLGFGPILYWLFGTNRIRTHAQSMFRRGYWNHRTKTERDHWYNCLPANHRYYKNDYLGILQVSDKVTRRPLMMGNRLETFHLGEEVFQRMITSITKAEKFVYLCSYIFEVGEIGVEIIKALDIAKKRGVQIRVLVDAFGEIYSSPKVDKLLSGYGIKFSKFLPLSLSLNSLHFNLRNHRKMLVVDGKTAFLGGMNIRDRHLSDYLPKKNRIADIHFQIDGPVVMELQEAFLEDWYFATSESLPWYASKNHVVSGDSVCRAISGGPNEDFEKIEWIILGAISSARKSIQIMTPYFVPDRILISALNTAALRGVEVEVIVPKFNNLIFVDWASQALFWELLEKGVKIYYQPAPFAHSKLFIIDQTYSLIGSSNWDSRSLRLNFELDLEVYDANFSETLVKHFENTKEKSQPVTLQDVNKKHWLVQSRNSFMKLFTPYL